LPPLSDGGAAVSAYVIERKEKTSPTWFRVARVKPHTTSYTVTNLMESTEYMFRVFAENIEGIGIPLTLEHPVIPRRPTGKSVVVGYLPNVFNNLTMLYSGLTVTSTACLSLKCYVRLDF